VERPIGTRGGVAARPSAHIDGVHRRAVTWREAKQHAAESLDVELPVAKGGVEAAPAPPMRRDETEVRQRRLRPRGHDRIKKIAKGVPSSAEARMDGGAERP
jgi:hypothetical protein